MTDQSSTFKHTSDITSKLEGENLGEMRKLWRDIAASEMRLTMMSGLKGKNIGFNEVENFSLGMKYNFKSEKMKDLKDKPIERVIEAAMATKMRDEVHHHYELRRKRELKKKRLGEQYHPKTKTYKKIIQYLREEAAEVKRIQGEKNMKKIEHLEKKYRETGEEEMMAPQGMEEVSHLSVFHEEKFEKIEKDKIKVPRVGEILLSKEEEKILQRSPKFAIIQNLQENTIKEEMEKAYSIVRMELRDEDDKDVEEQEDEKREENAEEQEKKEKQKEEEARTRQVYDPLRKNYDERRRRVTDLVECSRVVLPKPLSIVREAEIENRRNIHDQIYQKYRKENTNNKGEQVQNIDREEKTGLQSLMKRVKDGEAVVIRCVQKNKKFDS